MDPCILKLAIIVSLAELLAKLDFDIVDGAESELTLTDGQVFVIAIRRERQGQRKVTVKKEK